MRTVYVTGGYTGVLEVDTTSGVDLTGATFKVALVDEATDGPIPPAADSPLWLPATVVGGTATTVKLSLTSTAPGHYGAWLQVAVGGIVVPVRVLDESGARWLVLVV